VEEIEELEEPQPRKKKPAKKKKKVEKKPVNPYAVSNAQGSTFWISLADFCKYFYVLHISYTNKHYIQSFCQD